MSIPHEQLFQHVRVMVGGGDGEARLPPGCWMVCVRVFVCVCVWGGGGTAIAQRQHVYAGAHFPPPSHNTQLDSLQIRSIAERAEALQQQDALYQSYNTVLR